MCSASKILPANFFPETNLLPCSSFEPLLFPISPALASLSSSSLPSSPCRNPGSQCKRPAGATVPFSCLHFPSGHFALLPELDHSRPCCMAAYVMSIDSQQFLCFIGLWFANRNLVNVWTHRQFRPVNPELPPVWHMCMPFGLATLCGVSIAAKN